MTNGITSETNGITSETNGEAAHGHYSKFYDWKKAIDHETGSNGELCFILGAKGIGKTFGLSLHELNARAELTCENVGGHCSERGSVMYDAPNNCPNCGAKVITT